MKKIEKKDILDYLDRLYQADYDKLISKDGVVDYAGLTRLALITRVKMFILTGVE